MSHAGFPISFFIQNVFFFFFVQFAYTLSHSPKYNFFVSLLARLHEALNCFSLVRNTNTIFNTKVRPNDLTYLHGIRVLTMFWIILLHIGGKAPQRSLPTGIYLK